jgi:hypothetical protein
LHRLPKIYDGDGNLVKSIVNEVVTYYVGRHYHKAVDGVDVAVKKYYAIGMSQIAVRTNGELNWILTDHLSSASVSASVDGTLVSEVKYREAPAPPAPHGTGQGDASSTCALPGFGVWRALRVCSAKIRYQADISPTRSVKPITRCAKSFRKTPSGSTAWQMLRKSSSSGNSISISLFHSG